MRYSSIKTKGIFDTYNNVKDQHIKNNIFYTRSLFQRKDNILHIVAQIGQILLSENDINININESLSLLGNTINQDRIYVFEMKPDTDSGYLISQRYEWTSSGISVQIDNPDLQNVKAEPDFTRWINLFLSQKYIRGNVADFPPEEQPLLQEQDIVSILVIPIFIENVCWGFAGFDDCRKEDNWSDAEIAILSTLASSIGMAIVKWRRKTELIEAKEKAEESEKLKMAFLQNISHEIRTPLNSISGFIDLLNDNDYPKEVQKEYLAIMKSNSQRLLNTLNEIIDMAKIEAGTSKSHYSTINVAEIIEDIHSFFQPEASKKGLQLITDYQEKDITIQTDEEKFYSILTNLIKNAIKYSEKGCITIGFTKGISEVVIYIKDEGIGIPADQFEEIFKRFRQVDNSSSRSHEGAGLGLSIVKSYIDQLGGKIWLDSEMDKGSTFYFSLPV
ncbi:MAG: ATP-binding protein [Bacteroidales bacterium]